jgi:glucose-6-phosphate isomerase
MDANQAWASIEAAEPQSLTELFAAEPDRLERLALDLPGLHLDFSKTHLSAPLLAAFQALAEARDLAGARDALFAGAIVNPTEGRAAEHSAERGQGAPESVALASGLRARMRALIDAIEAEAFGPVRHVLHIGIGGSALGPDFLIDALGRGAGRYDCAVVSNVDGAALEEAVAGFDPHSTLLVVASKTFTTLETLLNARSALAWMEQGGVADPYGRIVALTASPSEPSNSGSTRPASFPFRRRSAAAIRSGPRSAFPRRSRSAGARSRSCSKERRRWTAISASRRGRERARPRRLRRPLLRQFKGRADPRRLCL